MYMDDEKRLIRQKQIQNRNNCNLKTFIINFPLDDQESVNNQETGVKQHEYFEDEFIEIPVDPLVEDVTDLLEIYTKACQYAETSKQWNQLENILRSVWN